jgi:type IV pilus assembly protein PilB
MAIKDKEKKEKTDIKLAQLLREQEEQRAKNLAAELGFPYFDLRIATIDDEALLISTEPESREAKAAIIQKKQNELFTVVIDPKLKQTTAFIKHFEGLGYKTNILIGSKSGLEKALAKYKTLKPKKTEISKEVEMNTEEFAAIQKEIKDIRDLKEKLAQPNLSTTQLLNIIMASALKLEASDIHFEAQGDQTTRLRFRLDGILQDAADILSSVYQLLLSRIKILSELKLNVHNVPQDGRFSFISAYGPGGGKQIENRVSIIPADYGENIVIRILDPKTINLNLNDLGIQDFDYKIIEKELQKPNGMILTTGPTGSGKTTLLYACLKKVNSPESKIITLENPIEYHLEGIEQTQVDSEEGYTFAAGLRSILRQDPDIILVGEVRDNETAETAINAALTGHLVFSTLHTNDAAGAIPRLVDMKVNPTLIPPALNLVIAQRLVRKVCSKCSKEIKPDKETMEKIKTGLESLPARGASELARVAGGPKLDNITIKQISKEGCAYCNFTGYKGRVGVFELFIIDDVMEKVILKTPSNVEIKESAIKAGMVLMRQDGLLKVLQKITTMDEVERILGV